MPALDIAMLIIIGTVVVIGMGSFIYAILNEKNDDE